MYENSIMQLFLQWNEQGNVYCLFDMCTFLHVKWPIQGHLVAGFGFQLSWLNVAWNIRVSEWVSLLQGHKEATDIGI